MSEARAGFFISGEKVALVHATVPDAGPITIEADQTWKLQSGPREDAYHVLYQQCVNYLREHAIRRAVLKASAVTLGSMKKAHLESAEVRGVVIAAAAAVCKVRTVGKANISRNFGSHKVDEYVKDDLFWEQQTDGVKLRNGSREAALLLIADRES